MLKICVANALDLTWIDHVRHIVSYLPTGFQAVTKTVFFAEKSPLSILCWNSQVLSWGGPVESSEHLLMRCLTLFLMYNVNSKIFEWLSSESQGIKQSRKRQKCLILYFFHPLGLQSLPITTKTNMDANHYVMCITALSNFHNEYNYSFHRVRYAKKWQKLISNLII